MNNRIFYPGGKTKALVFSYDDGQQYDRRLVEIFNKYNLKGTFNLNCSKFDEEGFITRDEIKDLYAGHEVACHGVEHLYPNQPFREKLLYELLDNRVSLESLTGDIVKGFAYAYGEYSDRVISMAKELGIVYARTVNDTMGYNVPGEFMTWHPTCHHNKAFDNPALTDTFLNPPDYMELATLFIWGHSFEFERENTWNKMEALCEKLSNKNDIWYTTCIDYYRYITAIRNLESNVEGSIINNPSKTPVYIEVNDEIKII